MSKYQTMPTKLSAGSVPHLPVDDWIAAVEQLLGRPLGKVDHAFALALAEHHNWTAIVVADRLRLMDATPAMLEVLRDIDRFAEPYHDASEGMDGPRVISARTLLTVREAIAKATVTP